MERGDKDEAIRLFTQAIASGELNSRNRAIAYNNRGRVYDEKGDFDLAIADYTDSIQIEPNASAYHNRGLAYGKAHRYNVAIADFTAAISLKPESAGAYSGRGSAFALNGIYDRAIADFNQAIRLAPNDVDAYIFRGQVYTEMGQYDLAIIDFDDVIRRKSNSPRAYRHRGTIRFAFGQFAEAAKDFDQARKLNPPGVREMLWRHIASSKARQINSDELKANINRLSLDSWPGAVVSLYVNESTIEKTRSAVLQGDSKTAHDQRCEADFFIGEYELSRKRIAEAKRLLKRVADTCSGTYEYIGATSELGRLGAKLLPAGRQPH